MDSIKKYIYDVLRGRFLTDKSAFKNWRFIIFIVLLLLIIITSAHSIDKKVIEISKLNKKKRELRVQYIDTKTILMQMQMESNIRQRVKSKGLENSKMPPQKITVLYEK